MRAGIQTVTRQLTRRGDGTYGLYLTPRCVHTIAEYGRYQYSPGEGDRAEGASSEPPELPELPELPLKQHDHALDATRYALHTALTRSRAREAAMEAWLGLYARRRGHARG